MSLRFGLRALAPIVPARVEANWVGDDEALLISDLVEAAVSPHAPSAPASPVKHEDHRVRAP